MVSLKELQEEDKKIRALIAQTTKTELIQMNLEIEKERTALYKKLEVMKKAQERINKALGIIYEEKRSE